MTTLIYFIRSPSGSIKIGTSTYLSRRLKQLAIEHGDGLEVLAVIPGSFERERELHQQFAHLREGGEWFRAGEDLMRYIATEGHPWDAATEVPEIRESPVRAARPPVMDVIKKLIDDDPRTMHEIAAAAGMKPAYFSQIYTGHRATPRMATVAAILAAIGKRWADLDGE